MVRDGVPHIFVTTPPTVTEFAAPPRPIKPRIPNRNRKDHSVYLLRRFEEAWAAAERDHAVVQASRSGVYIEVRGEPGYDLITKGLEDLRSKKVRLLNARVDRENDEIVTYATVYVDNDKRRFFIDRIEAFAKKETQSGRPKYADLINSISDIRKAVLMSFWQDDPAVLPGEEKRWCEVWLSSDAGDTVNRFTNLLRTLQLNSADRHLIFPERTVTLVYANRHDLENIIRLSDDVAELRLAKETAAFWLELENKDQADWVRDLQTRLVLRDADSTSVCILDTGVNWGHPLLQPIIHDADCTSVDPSWGSNDHHGHGTLMAGVAAYGDLRQKLEDTGPVILTHCLESVKILPPPPAVNKPDLWGHVTSQAISRAEIQAPYRNRVICLAVTADDTRDRGRPSSWSGALDQLAAGDHEEGVRPRLIIVAAGNARDEQLAASTYPDANLTDSIHDPGQAWNVVTVGAYTQLDEIRSSALTGFTAVARRGQISPFTTTSIDWDYRWPLKPDIVMEGGNLAIDRSGFATRCDDLSLVSTSYRPDLALFWDFQMTSAATAQASWLAAQIQSRYPEAWPETIRALMVHSAEWTDAMREQFLRDRRKSSYGRLLRICGYGVPNLERALHSATNSLTMIVQNQIQPFDRRSDGGYRTKEMHIYELPWPREVLQALSPEVEVRMRVTLSYFIEPSPGQVGWKDRYRYASHGLRFDIKAPTENLLQFQSRINRAAREEDEGLPPSRSASRHWVIGPEQRNRGSIHSDIWIGTPQELANSNAIAIYPIVGWWRERGYLGRWNRLARYSLVVTISTPEQSVDIYTPVLNKIQVPVQVAAPS